MSDTAAAFLRKADESLEAAELLSEKGYIGFAASRAYYAMFYAASAMLLSKNLSFSKHSAVIAAFGREFARSSATFAMLHRYLIDAESVRSTGDYSIETDVSFEQLESTLEHAREFLDVIHNTRFDN